MATTCLMGQTGPAAELAGYGYHAAAVSGFYEITGWDDRPPAGPFNAYTDTIAPRFLATTLLAALDHRRRTGEGQFIDQAQMESALHFLGPQLLDVQVSGHQRPAQRQRRPGTASRTTPTRAPATTSGARSRSRPTSSGRRCARCSASRRGRWTRRSTRVAGRRAAAATDRPRARPRSPSRHEPRELMELLQAAGVPAGMVQRSSDHQLDPQLAHRAFFRRLRAPGDGRGALRGPPVPRSPATTTARASRRRASASTPTRCSPRCSASTTTRSARSSPAAPAADASVQDAGVPWCPRADVLRCPTVNRRGLSVVVLVASVALGLGACSSDASSSTTTKASTTTAATTTTTALAPVGSASDQLCAARETLRTSITDLSKVDVVKNGTSAITAQLDTIKTNLSAGALRGRQRRAATGRRVPDGARRAADRRRQRWHASRGRGGHVPARRGDDRLHVAHQPRQPELPVARRPPRTAAMSSRLADRPNLGGPRSTPFERSR